MIVLRDKQADSGRLGRALRYAHRLLTAGLAAGLVAALVSYQNSQNQIASDQARMEKELSAQAEQFQAELAQRQVEFAANQASASDQRRVELLPLHPTLQVTYLLADPPQLLVQRLGGEVSLDVSFPPYPLKYDPSFWTESGTGLLSGESVDCLSESCLGYLEELPEGGNAYAYILIENVGQSTARDIEIVWSQKTVERLETLNYFEFLPADGLAVKEGIGDLGPGAGLLLPLAALHVFGDEPPRPLVPLGFARSPESASFYDEIEDATVAVRLRGPLEGVVLSFDGVAVETGG